MKARLGDLAPCSKTTLQQSISVQTSASAPRNHIPEMPFSAHAGDSCESDSERKRVSHRARKKASPLVGGNLHAKSHNHVGSLKRAPPRLAVLHFRSRVSVTEPCNAAFTLAYIKHRRSKLDEHTRSGCIR